MADGSTYNFVEKIHTHEQKILSRAADLLEEHGWCQGVFCGPKRSMCAAGAIMMATGERHPGSCFDIYILTLVQRRLGGQLVSRWNDAPERTKEEVVGLLRELANG